MLIRMVNKDGDGWMDAYGEGDAARLIGLGWAKWVKPEKTEPKKVEPVEEKRKPGRPRKGE